MKLQLTAVLVAAFLISPLAVAQDPGIEPRLEARIEAKVGPIRQDLAALKRDVEALKAVAFGAPKAIPVNCPGGCIGGKGGGQGTCGSYLCPTNGGFGGCPCDTPARSPAPVVASSPVSIIPAGYGRWDTGPLAGTLFRLTPEPATSSPPMPAVTASPPTSGGCYTDPATGRTVCPYRR